MNIIDIYIYIDNILTERYVHTDTTRKTVSNLINELISHSIRIDRHSSLLFSYIHKQCEKKIRNNNHIQQKIIVIYTHTHIYIYNQIKLIPSII